MVMVVWILWCGRCGDGGVDEHSDVDAVVMVVCILTCGRCGDGGVDVMA